MGVKDSAPTIPPVPLDVPATQRAFLQALKDAVALRLGQTANQLDRSPTLRELLSGDFGDITINQAFGGVGGGGGGGGTPYDPFNDASAPPAPTGLTAVTAGPQAILLNWNAPPSPNPGTPPYVAFTEVFSYPTDSINDAVLVGIGWNSFIHNVEPVTTHYYWIRFRSHSDVAGPFHPVLNGVTETTPQDPTQYLTLLTNAITETELFSTLTARIDKIDTTTILGQAGLDGAVTFLDGVDTAQQVTIDGHTTSIGTNTSDISAQSSSLTATITRVDTLDTGVFASATNISQLESAVNDAVQDADAAVNTANAAASDVVTLTTRTDTIDGGVFASATNISQIESDITSGDATNASAISTLATTTAGPGGAEAQYTIKVDANGNIAGFGLSSTSTGDLADPGFTEAIFVVDRFSVVNTSGGGAAVPFVVDGSQVVMDGATIKDATIASASIDSAGILTAAIGNAQITNAKIQDSTIQNGKIANATIQSAKIGNGQILTANIGTAQITNAKIQNAAVNTLKIEDDAVTVPVGAYASGPVVCVYNATQGTTVATLVIDSQQQPIYIHCFAHRFRNGNDADGFVGVRRNGSFVWGPTSFNLKDQDKRQQIAAAYYDASPPSGTNTYEIRFAPASGDTWNVTEITSFAIGMKK